MLRLAVLVVLVVLVAPAVASAQADCHAITPDDTRAASAWTGVIDGVRYGACEDGGTCFVVGASFCALRAGDEGEATPRAVLHVAGATIVVWRWLYERGGAVYWAGEATEVWRVDGAPAFVLSVVESYDEGEAAMRPVLDEVTCSLRRWAAVDETGVRVGPRSAHGDCEAATELDRRGDVPIAATDARWTWAQLGVSASSAMALGGMGGGGVGEGCIGLATTCAARAGFGDRPAWCRRRDAATASRRGRIALVSVTGVDADALRERLAEAVRRVADCQQEAIAARPAGAVGEIVVALRFEHGCVSSARLVSATVPDARFAECAAGVLLGASVDAAGGERRGRARIRIRASLAPGE